VAICLTGLRATGEEASFFSKQRR